MSRTIGNVLAANQEIDVFPLAALCLITKNPHQGHQLPTAALHRGFAPINSSTVTGFATSLYDDGRRSRCTGKERDAESGLDYFGARYMSSAQGRFSSPDPDNYDARLEQPQSWNMYGYTWNNPIKFTDNDGRAVNLALAGIGAGMGFGTGFVGSAVSQYIQNGSVDWGTATAYGAGGAVAGATAGLTFGGSLLVSVVADVSIATVGNVAGGVAVLRPGILMDSSLGTFEMENVLFKESECRTKRRPIPGTAQSPSGLLPQPRNRYSSCWTYSLLKRTFSTSMFPTSCPGNSRAGGGLVSQIAA